MSVNDGGQIARRAVAVDRCGGFADQVAGEPQSRGGWSRSFLDPVSSSQRSIDRHR
jgi:hypothetical protein